MHIDDLPLELHADIVALACAEIPSPRELTTAHALSLVSSYWYSVARPFKYHSLRVAGTYAIASLLARVEMLPERERRVRYLSLSDAPLESAAIDEACLYRQKSTIARLFALLAPSLFMLELRLANHAYSTSLFAVLWTLSAPHLISLSVKGCYPFPTAPLDPSAPNLKSNFPCLEHLLLDGLSNPSGLLSFGTLERAFPRLVTLEVRGLCSALAFAREVAAAVRERDERLKTTVLSKTSAVPSYLPRTLVLLSLFPATDPCDKYSKRGQTMHAEMLKALTPLATRDESKTKSALRVVVGESVRYNNEVYRSVCLQPSTFPTYGTISAWTAVTE